MTRVVALCACLTGCSSSVIGVQFDTPEGVSAVIRRVNARAKSIDVPGYANLPVKKRRDRLADGRRVRCDGVSLEIETSTGVISRAFVSTWNFVKVVDIHFVDDIVSLGGPGTWSEEGESITWDMSESSRKRFIYVRGGESELQFEGEILPPPPLTRFNFGFEGYEAELHREFEGLLHQVEEGPCTVNLGGLEIQCLIPEGTFLRVEQVKSRRSVIELRGLLARSDIATSAGDHDGHPVRLPSPVSNWVRYSLPAGSGIRVPRRKGADLVRITREMLDTKPIAVRIDLISLGSVAEDEDDDERMSR